MQSSRDFFTLKKPKLTLTKSFVITKNLEIGQIGQLRLSGVVESEHINEIDNGNEYLTKTIFVDRLNLVNQKDLRIEKWVR